MKRRQLLAMTGLGIAGVVTTKRAVSGESPHIGDTIRLGLAPTVPAFVRSDDRASVVAQLRDELPVLTSLRVDRAASEWALLRGLANADFDVVELGGVAGTAALEAGLAKPLLQPALADAWEYNGELLATCNKRQSVSQVAVGEPLATPTHAALVEYGTEGIPAQTTIRWHVSQPAAALDNSAVTFAASDEFHASPNQSRQTSYSLPVPGLYVRPGVENTSVLQNQFTAVTGGNHWYSEVRTSIDRGDAGTWLNELSLPVNPP